MLEHIWGLLHSREIPRLPEDLAGIPLLKNIHEELAEARRVIQPGLPWLLDEKTEGGNILSRCIKDLQHKFSRISQRGHTANAPEDRKYHFRYLASHDTLTGAFNRRTFVERAAIELQVAFGQNKECCLAVICLDHLEAFTERCGQAAGDGALKHTAKTLSAGLRKTDFMGRHKGERFIFFFQETDIDTCRVICGRLLKNLEAAPFMLNSEPVYITGRFSVVAAYPGEFGVKPESPYFFVGSRVIQEMTDRADKALYEAKNRRSPGAAAKEVLIYG
jgi:diguanylate cyclase (GGDEF)-like protein